MVFSHTYYRFHNQIKEFFNCINLNYVTFTAFILVIIETYGKKMKTFKYYHFTTLVIYEFIWFMSIFTYAYSSMKENCIDFKALQNWPFIVRSFSIVMNFMVCGLAHCSHWMQNTYVHVALCQRKVEVSQPEEKLLNKIH